MLTGVEHKVIQGAIMLSCKAKLPKLSLAIAKKWLVMNPEDMILDISAAQDKSLCMFAFLPNTSSFWILG